MALNTRSSNPPYDEVTLTFREDGGKVYNVSDTYKFRLWNTMGGGSVAIPEVDITFSASPTELLAVDANSGTTPPYTIRQVASGVGSITNSESVTDWKNIGYNTYLGTWATFSLTNDGYGSSGNSDGIIADDGWCEFEIYYTAPSGLQSALIPIYMCYNV